MTTLTVTQTTDFRGDPAETGIDSLVFADPTFDSVTPAHRARSSRLRVRLRG